MAKKILVNGATGFIGRSLVSYLSDKGYEVVIMSRDVTKAQRIFPQSSIICPPDFSQDETLLADELSILHGLFGIINLAGAPIIGKRWTQDYKKVILASRVETTKSLVKLAGLLVTPPKVFICASAVGYYGSDYSSDIKTETAKAGDDFLADVCVQWEAAADEAKAIIPRVVKIRTAVVLSKDGGAFPLMALPFRFKLGGKILPGKQWFSWIALADLVRIYAEALENKKIEGAINASAPRPLTNADLTAELANHFRALSFFHVPSIGLRLVLGEAATALNKGQRVLPVKLEEEGYKFSVPAITNFLQT